jgi:hypothetical protein
MLYRSILILKIKLKVHKSAENIVRILYEELPQMRESPRLLLPKHIPLYSGLFFLFCLSINYNIRKLGLAKKGIEDSLL